MAACAAMRLRNGLLVAATLMLLVAGCSKVIDGPAVIGAPKPGPPLTGKACESASSDATDIPAGAECGMLSVPVDYSKPDGDIAQIAMIRFKATGAKIGSPGGNPRRPRD